MLVPEPEAPAPTGAAGVAPPSPNPCHRAGTANAMTTTGNIKEDNRRPLILRLGTGMALIRASFTRKDTTPLTKSRARERDINGRLASILTHLPGNSPDRGRRRAFAEEFGVAFTCRGTGSQGRTGDDAFAGLEMHAPDARVAASRAAASRRMR